MEKMHWGTFVVDTREERKWVQVTFQQPPQVVVCLDPKIFKEEAHKRAVERAVTFALNTFGKALLRGVAVTYGLDDKTFLFPFEVERAGHRVVIYAPTQKEAEALAAGFLYTCVMHTHLPMPVFS